MWSISTSMYMVSTSMYMVATTQIAPYVFFRDDYSKLRKRRNFLAQVECRLSEWHICLKKPFHLFYSCKSAPQHPIPIYVSFLTVALIKKSIRISIRAFTYADSKRRKCRLQKEELLQKEENNPLCFLVHLSSSLQKSESNCIMHTVEWILWNQ